MYVSFTRMCISTSEADDAYLHLHDLYVHQYDTIVQAPVLYCY